MKRVPVLMLSLLLAIMLWPSFASASSSTIQIFLDGKKIVPDVPPLIQQDTTLVPLRTIAEQLGADVSWNQKEQKVTVQNNDKSIELFIGKTTAAVNGSSYLLQTAPVLVQSTTMLPLRFVSEQLGMTVSWDQMTQSVFLFRQETTGGNSSAGNSGSGSTGNSSGTPSTNEGATDPANPPTETNPANPTPVDPSVPGSSANSGGTDTGTVTPVVNALIDSIESAGSQVFLKADGPMAVKDFYLSSPDRIVLDIENARMSPNLADPGDANQTGEIAFNQTLVKKVRYALNSPTTMRVVVELNKKVNYKLTGNEDGSQLTIDLLQSSKKFKIVLDAGHGAHDSGAVSVNNRLEKNFNLSIILKLQQLLKNDSDIEVYLTRADDTFVTLDGRAEFANKLGADLFLSVHGNKYLSTTQGTETYYCRSDNSILLANIVHKHVLAATGFPDRKVKQANYRVIKATTMPAVLTEIGFLSNKAEEEQMFNDAFQNKVAAELAAAIREFLHR